jgi:hypothetical protein
VFSWDVLLLVVGREPRIIPQIKAGCTRDTEASGKSILALNTHAPRAQSRHPLRDASTRDLTEKLVKSWTVRKWMTVVGAGSMPDL